MSMIEDLGKSIDEAISKTLDPIQKQRDVILDALNEKKREERELEAQLARVDRVLDAGKLRGKPGRKPGTPSVAKKRTPVTA